MMNIMHGSVVVADPRTSMTDYLRRIIVVFHPIIRRAVLLKVDSNDNSSGKLEEVVTPKLCALLHIFSWHHDLLSVVIMIIDRL